MIAALRHLELLVAIDPHLTPTAQLADYVIAPTLQYERADLPITLGMALHADAWVQYTAAHVTPPAGSDVVDDWRSEEHTSELQSVMRISYAVFCLKKKNKSKTK